MKMLNEADVDSQFNKYMDQLQSAIASLESTIKNFKKQNVKAANWQQLAFEVAINDLKKLKASFSA